MSLGPGRYDASCTKVREETRAEGVFLAVFDGEKGTGFSVQAPIDLVEKLPNILRNTARQIEESFDQGRL